MLGNRLKNLRKEKKLLQKELAIELNLSQETISLYESNKREPDYATLQKIADFFNVTTDYLLGRTDIRESLSESTNNLQDNITFEDLEMLKEIHKLSPESQHEIKKLIELYKIKDMQDRNTEFSDEISSQD